MSRLQQPGNTLEAAIRQAVGVRLQSCTSKLYFRTCTNADVGPLVRWSRGLYSWRSPVCTLQPWTRVRCTALLSLEEEPASLSWVCQSPNLPPGLARGAPTLQGRGGIGSGGESLKVWRLEQPWPSMAVVVHWRFGCAVLCVAGTTSHLRESLLRYGVKYVQLSMECLVINYCL